MQQPNFPKVRELSTAIQPANTKGGIRTTSMTPCSKFFYGTKWYNGFNLKRSLIISSCTRFTFLANRHRNGFACWMIKILCDRIKCLFTRDNPKSRKSTPRQLRNTCIFFEYSFLFKSLLYCQDFFFNLKITLSL